MRFSGINILYGCDDKPFFFAYFFFATFELFEIYFWNSRGTSFLQNVKSDKKTFFLPKTICSWSLQSKYVEFGPKNTMSDF